MNEIKCPKCGHAFDLSEAFKEKVYQEAEKKVEENYKEKFEILEREQKKAISQAQEEAREKAAREVDTQLKDLKEQNKEKDAETKKMKEDFLKLSKEKRELESKEEKREIEFEKRLDEERKNIKGELSKTIGEESKLKLKEKDVTIDKLKKQLDDMKKTAEQGSQKTQGEALEQAFEEKLKEIFPDDIIEPVPSGQAGADLIQKVYDKSKKHCGTILWESKRTKNFQKNWIEKLKNDRRKAKADVAILLSQALPQDISGFGEIEGVCITNYSSFIGLTMILRTKLIEFNSLIQSNKNRKDKVGELYDFVTSSEFKQSVEATVEAFKSLRDDLEDEKRAYQRIWAKREKQIDKITQNIISMYGSLEGIAGGTIKQIKSLGLKYLSERGISE